jgi:hypothetical protein
LQNHTVFVFTVAITFYITLQIYTKKDIAPPFVGQYLTGRLKPSLSTRPDYSALLQSTHVLSHCAHFVESQHSVAQHESAFSQAWSQPSHSVHSTAFSELLLHAHEAAANIAATTANDINTFFMVTKINL